MFLVLMKLYMLVTILQMFIEFYLIVVIPSKYVMMVNFEIAFVVGKNLCCHFLKLSKVI